MRYYESNNRGDKLNNILIIIINLWDLQNKFIFLTIVLDNESINSK